MPLYLTSLNSGSNGNAYFIGNGVDAVLIDAGISCREMERRLFRLDLSARMIRAVFISHEHTDHIRGADVIARKFGIPVYITEATYRSSRVNIDASLRRPFKAGTPVEVGSLTVKPFSKWHDAAEPHSFIVTEGNLTAGVFTDIGMACEEVIGHLKQCNAAFLEANYDDHMLETGRYPAMLKRRIRGAEGHLSNAQALDLFLSHRSPDLQLLVLSHLSQENNHPQLVADLFAPYAENIRIEVATRYAETEVFTIQ